MRSNKQIREITLCSIVSLPYLLNLAKNNGLHI